MQILPNLQMPKLNFTDLIRKATDMIESEMSSEPDLVLRKRLKQIARFLTMASSDYENIVFVRELKAERVIIVDNKGQVKLATNAQLLKLAIMKGSIKDVQTDTSETRRVYSVDEVEITKRRKHPVSQLSIFRDTLDASMP